MNDCVTVRKDVFCYAYAKYGSTPEYLWASTPTNAILRHDDNNKWYAVVLSISKSKLGLAGNELVDILDVKCEPVLIGSLLQKYGFFPAYHMNKDKWITVLLDGSVPKEEIFNLIDLSFDLTKKKNRKN